jgi:hypothetical protein
MIFKDLDYAAFFTLSITFYCYTSDMKSLEHINNALTDLDNEMQTILMDFSLNLTQKDNLMLPILLQKKVLKQTLDDLTYLKENPPTPNQPCGISKHRDDK